MTRSDKRIIRFMAKPTPRDATLSDVIHIANALDIKCRPGTNHSIVLLNPIDNSPFPVFEDKGVIPFVYVGRLQKIFKYKMEEEQE